MPPDSIHSSQEVFLSTTKEELVALNIRNQIAYLEGLLVELAQYPDLSMVITQRTREVENQLRKLRARLGS